MMRSMGHRIFFEVSDVPGFIEIKKSSWTNFSYTCVINNVNIAETAANAYIIDSVRFEADVRGYIHTKDPKREEKVTWYSMNVQRLTDMTSTVVHRRFSEFVTLDDTIKATLKDAALPSLPEKSFKLTTNHLDIAFIEKRRQKLDLYMKTLVRTANVSALPQVRTFLGFPDEVSTVFFLFGFLDTLNNCILTHFCY